MIISDGDNTMLQEFRCEKMNITFRSKDTSYQRSLRLRNALTRKNISIFAYLRMWKISHYNLRCAWCGDFNHDIAGIEHYVDNGCIIPTNVFRRHTAPYLCFSKNTCESKKLNKNSVEFITKAYGIDEKDALEKIHSRNSSPFYKENHQNDDDYKKSQSRSKEWFEINGKDRNTWINKANYSRSYQGYVANNNGDDWNIVQQRKAITLENFIKKYGEDDGTIRYTRWKEGTNLSINTYIKKYGKIKGTEQYLRAHIKSTDDVKKCDLYDDFINRIADIVKGCQLHQYHMFNLEKEMKLYKFYEIAKDFFEKSVIELEKDISIILPEYRKNHRKIFNNNYSCYSYTDLGTILKSLNEIRIYDYLSSIGLKEFDDFVVNGRYPNSTLFFDIWLIHQNTYIEIAGGDSQEYKEHMKNKENLFGSIIVDPNNYKQIIIDILNGETKRDC